MKNGQSLQKTYVKGFGSIAPSDERIAEIRFTELDPETKYDLYVIMSSEQPIEKRAIWNDFRVVGVETDPFAGSLFSLSVSMLMTTLGMLMMRE